MQKDLHGMLHEGDAALLPILAKRWGVKTDHLRNNDDIIAALVAVMLSPANAEKVYDALDDKQRGALQTLIGAGRKMNAVMFTKMFGEIRKMGAGRIEREKPHENPASVAEALYYRGLIGQGTDKVGVGMGMVIYIPEDMVAVLPLRKTGYSADILQSEAAVEKSTIAAGGISKPEVEILPLEDVENIQQADTSIVDDLTTFLAYLQLYSAELDSADTLSEADRDKIKPHLLVQDDARLNFLLGIGLSADLVEVQSGKAYPKRAEARRWLEGKRSAQLKTLAESWRRSTVYRDLWHTPGLHFEDTGWAYDPAAARQGVLVFMQKYIPQQEWWSLDDFIFGVKDVTPDFQRPGGDFDSWYIRNDQNDFLNGFESWDAVEGALLEFYLFGPMHWLGLVDLAEDAARLNAYGRAFIDGGQNWPNPAEPEEKTTIQPDGVILISRKVSRIDRFQVARFTSWMSPATLKGGVYTYKLDSQGIQRADQQGINTGHIGTFIQRALDNAPVPPYIAKLLENWRGGATAQVTLEQLLVMRTTAPETLDAIFNNPALRRYLGARLGPMAVVVRMDQWEALRDALGTHGIQMETIS